MLGGGGMTDPDSAVLGGGGTTEQEESAVAGGGGTTEQEESAVLGGGGMADPDSAVLGGGGIAEQESAVLGGGGMADPDRAVRGGGGIREQDSAVLGGGGMNDPERAGLPASASAYCQTGLDVRPSSSPRSSSPGHAALAPDSMSSWCAGTGPGSIPWPPQISSGSSEVHTTTRVRSPRNRSLANSSGSPERA
jgi:hypothetical protein